MIKQTNKVSHTPGPWKVEGKEQPIISKGIHIVAPDGSTVTVNLGAKSEECLANAGLIAAAPELLEVTKLIVKEWEAPTEGVQRGELIARLSQYAKEARDAIAKAEGR